MTNNQNNSNDNQEEECAICSAYSYFTTLINETPTSVEEAFHDSIDLVVESIIDDLTDAIGEKSFSDGFDVGYAAAYKAMAEQMAYTSEMLNEELNSSCDDCDCTEGYCKTEDDGTNYKTDTVEDKIRNAIRED